MTAAVAAVSRALGESWARRPEIVAWIRGGRSVAAPASAESLAPTVPARIVSTTKSGLPSVSR